MLSLAELEEIQAAAMADDVDISLERMSLWSHSEAVAFFESGGTQEPEAASPSPAPTAPTPTPAPVKPLGRKPRIAILHGTCGNDTIVKMQLGMLLGKLRTIAEVHIIEGGRPVAPTNRQIPIFKRTFGENVKLLEYAPARLDERGWRVYDELDEGDDATKRLHLPPYHACRSPPCRRT